MISRVFRIDNELGLHARAAARLVKLASTFSSDVKLGRDGAHEFIDGKSILGLLLLGAAKGTELRVTAQGPDAEAAVDAIGELIQNRFGEAR